MDINLIFDHDRILFDDVVAASEGNIRAQRNLVKSCLADEKDQHLDDEKAEEIMKRLTFGDVARCFREIVKKAQEVPLASGGTS